MKYFVRLQLEFGIYWSLLARTRVMSFTQDSEGDNLIVNEQFFLSPQCFFTHFENFRLFTLNLELLSAYCLSLEASKIYYLVNG